MLGPGILYVFLGIFIRFFIPFLINKQNEYPTSTRHSLRLSMHFIMVGSFNTIIGVWALFYTQYKLEATMLGGLSIALFCLLVLFEFNRSYREFRNRLDKIMEGDDK